MKTPVPRVLAWCSKSHENLVGAEYIIMEKVVGIELEQVWKNMDVKARFALVKNHAKHQTTWSSIAFHKFGCLYYASDLDSTTSSTDLVI